jgi:hypothetical protein
MKTETTRTVTATDPGIDSLLLDLVDWLTKRERTYEEVTYVLGSAFPRLPILEEGMHRGFVIVEEIDRRYVVKPTSFGVIRSELRREARRRGRRDQATLLRTSTSCWIGKPPATGETLFSPRSTFERIAHDWTGRYAACNGFETQLQER